MLCNRKSGGAFDRSSSVATACRLQMSGLSARWLNARIAAIAASMLLGSCAVGPDFLHPAAPEDAGYTKGPLARRTSSTDAPTGQPQRFVNGRNVPERWWALFKSPALSALMEHALNNNPTLQSAIATLRAAREQVYAQEGKFFPLVQANFNPTYQRTSAALTPIPASGAQIFQLHTAQVEVSYALDVWGLNRRTVKSLEAQADAQRFQVEAAYLTLTANVAVAAITEASLRGQIDATKELIATNTKMLDGTDLALSKTAMPLFKNHKIPSQVAWDRSLLWRWGAIAHRWPAGAPLSLI